MLEMFTRTNKQLLHVRKLLHDPLHEADQKDLDEALEAAQPQLVKFYINAFFLSLIGLLCLLVLFSTLAGMPAPF